MSVAAGMRCAARAALSAATGNSGPPARGHSAQIAPGSGRVGRPSYGSALTKDKGSTPSAASGGRGVPLASARVGHSLCTGCRRSQFPGLSEWARGELNHQKTPMNAGLQAVRALLSAISGYLAVRGAPDAPSGGTCTLRVQPVARMLAVLDSRGERPTTRWPTTLRPARTSNSRCCRPSRWCRRHGMCLLAASMSGPQ